MLVLGFGLFIVSSVIVGAALLIAPSLPDSGAVAFSALVADGNRVDVIDVDQHLRAILGGYPASVLQRDLSPNGRYVAFDMRTEAGNDILVRDLETDEIFNLTNEPEAVDFYGAWSPDGGRIVFSSDRAGSLDIYYLEFADHSIHRLTHDPDFDLFPVWSPDGEYIAFESNRNGNSDIFIVHVESGEERQLTVHPTQDTAPFWSPDGRHVGFLSLRDGHRELYTVNLESGVVHKLTNGSSFISRPVWLAKTELGQG